MNHELHVIIVLCAEPFNSLDCTTFEYNLITNGKYLCSALSYVLLLLIHSRKYLFHEKGYKMYNAQQSPEMIVFKTDFFEDK